MHFAGELMTRRVWEAADIRVVSLPAMPIAATQTSCNNLDHTVIVARLWNVKSDDVDAATELGVLKCQHGEPRGGDCTHTNGDKDVIKASSVQ